MNGILQMIVQGLQNVTLDIYTCMGGVILILILMYGATEILEVLGITSHFEMLNAQNEWNESYARYEKNRERQEQFRAIYESRHSGGKMGWNARFVNREG